ncbi:uncharacterized protein LOC133520395 [Cydia pomonella]|uniref:uncharacterized protein LOC133520395 n=1 Tax=Cydia pomonella TaxID=82600 RepID=UPI002ADD8475|nr:uncharacterized protein LOC133520395 [Cydia pomonella]
MVDEKDLIRKRGSYKGQLTLFTTYLGTVKESTLSQAEASQLQMRIGKIEALYELYDDVQTQLECSSDNLDAHIAERDEFQNNYFSVLSRAQDMLNNFNKKRDEFELCSNRGSQSGSGNRKLVKLPTIQLPKFQGSYENWLGFRDTFTSLIHSNDDIDNINKFHYLRASLEGSAALVIHSIEFSGSNYEVAWTLLCERYDNKRLLLQNHVSALFNVEPITKESSVQLKRLVDHVNKNLRCLESLGEPVKHWDTLLIHIISNKLDTKTYREWEEHKGSLDKSVPISFDNFITFMRNRADLIETLELSSASGAGQSSQPAKIASKHRTLLSTQTTKHCVTSSSKPCPKCNGDHNLNSCGQFLALSNAERLNLLPSYKICFNCFRSGHYANQCKKAGCKLCKRKHNSLIHVAEHNLKTGPSSCERSGAQTRTAPAQVAGSATVTTLSASMSTAASQSCASKQGVVLLATALIKVYGHNNREFIVKAVLDNGSATSIMTEKMCRQLNLHADQVDRSIVGVNKLKTPVGKICQVPMKSLDDTYSTRLICSVLPSITEPTPYHQIDSRDISRLNIPSDLCLADPNFHTPSEIDILIGGDLFWGLLGSHKIELGDGRTVLCETKLGYIVAGPLISGHASTSSHAIKCNFANVISNTSADLINDEVQTQLARFWQLEEVCPKDSQYSLEEKSCEKHFTETVTRLENGQFCVRLPLKEDPSILGNSFNRARQCFLSLERRIDLRPNFRDMYKEFMAEYESLNHMTECKESQLKYGAYYIPHHGILRESSTTKLRVVFNASAPTSSGVSLNKIQMVGPIVQDDLLSILLRFRQHKYIISADVEKMYRQIVVHPDDTYLQRILWRDDSSKPLKIFELNTVTYGTASAPFLATRCLKQLGLECKDEVVREVIIHDFYVDDLLTGGDDLQQVLSIKSQVTSTLASAGMNLRKWKSNEPQLMVDSDSSQLDLNIGTEPSKTLGLSWRPGSDELCFPVGQCSVAGKTKRDLLSAVAQIFDPTGVLAPCVILMKMLLQNLWLQKLSWDQKLTPEISKIWEGIVRDLPCLNDIRIPRLVLCESYEEVECHIFTDASERAYGACLYLRSTNRKGDVLVRLLLAKSRVAPIKPTTIPRLELSGALAGVRLYEKVVDSLRISFKSITFWTDSTIVLGWLRMLPSKLQPFVRNRVAEILEKTGNCTWRHVPTQENPADHVSRGIPASLLKSLDIWWSGPTFLQQDKSLWPVSSVVVETLPEIRSEVVLHANVTNNRGEENGDGLIDFSRFSNLSRLIRTVSCVVRFASLCRKQIASTVYLTDSELRTALTIAIRVSQTESFSEYNILLSSQPLPKKSPLLKLNVFLDDKKIIRVGGRIDNSNFSFEKKHPIVIHAKHPFTKLLFESEHKRLMHAGPQLLLSSVKDEYWPIGGTNLAKACFQKCLKCVRMRGQVIAPLMGNLPASRLIPGMPFKTVGVDYAGPLTSASRQGRGCRLVKVYIAIFVCFTTKAVHLELVGDLTSDSYLSALRRFVSRRGLPTDIYSDNGTSFVGAYNELSKFLKSNCDSLAEAAAHEKINFHFIPAYSPHSGGLWEAGVKSTKFHLKRVLGDCNLTYELLNTVLVQIEAVLNSRPLTPMSSDAQDLLPLTPGHFLIGRPLTSLPVKDIREHEYNYLNRYQRIEQLRQHFWGRWSKEYVSELQVRTKWRTNNEVLQLNTLVLIKEDNLPPLKWKLGRIVAVHPGSDGVTRVADIRTAGGLVRRSFSKICPLPITTNESG